MAMTHGRDAHAATVFRERIREAGLGLGFRQVGFAPAEEPAHAAWYREWVTRGWHGEMGYMAREDSLRRRLDPVEALAGCRTLIVVSLSYAAAETADERSAPPGRYAADERGAADGSDAGVIARYARGRDYHHVFEERLSALAEAVRALAPDARTKPYVDHGPVMERDHAQRAGLGWIGKNTVLIHPEHGSWLLLGELLTTLELPPDEPFTADRCGSCTRCIDACPTDAIRGPRELDARRCISYLTIELRGSIPVDLRPLIGNRVFGCDICQEVCPWNGEVPEGDMEALGISTSRSPPSAQPTSQSAGPGRVQFGRPLASDSMIEWTEELLRLTDEQYRQRYRGTALRRPGREAMLRNLCVGLGNSGAEAAVPALLRCLEDPSPLVREHASWALGRLGSGAGDYTLSIEKLSP